MATVPTAGEIFEHFQKHKPVIEMAGQPCWVVESDLALDSNGLWSYALARAEQLRRQGADPEAREGLVAMTGAGGRPMRWAKGKALTYSVRRATFTAEQYQATVAGLNQATREWEAVCGVNFRHLAECDTGEPPRGEPLLFDVALEAHAAAGLIALAFFPSDPPTRRRLLLYPLFFAAHLPYEPVGVLRHELGHVLGFRHEHIRSGAPPDCPSELHLGYAFDLTAYDPRSVMHYFCPQSHFGTWDMRITELDRQGAARLYGPPDHEVEYY